MKLTSNNIMNVAVMSPDKLYIICPCCGDIHTIRKGDSKLSCEIPDITYHDIKLSITAYTIILDKEPVQTNKKLRQIYHCKIRNMIHELYNYDLNNQDHFNLLREETKNEGISY